MWTVHNSFGRWWPLRVHMMVHLDMNWSGDNLLTIFSFHGASFDTAKDLLIKLCIKPSIGDKHFFTFSLKPKLWTTSSKIVKFQLSKYFFSIKNQPNIADFFSLQTRTPLYTALLLLSSRDSVKKYWSWLLCCVTRRKNINYTMDESITKHLPFLLLAKSLKNKVLKCDL